MSNYATELISAMMRRISSRGTSALENLSTDIGSTPGSVVANQTDAAQSLQNNQKALDFAMGMVEDLSNQGKKQFSSVSQMAAATNQSIARKREALSELNKARGTMGTDLVQAQYFNPFTGQLEKGDGTEIDSADIRKRADADQNMLALFDIKKSFEDNGFFYGYQNLMGKAVTQEQQEAFRKAGIYRELVQPDPNDVANPFKAVMIETRDNEKATIETGKLTKQIEEQISRVRETLTTEYKNEQKMRSDSAQQYEEAANQASKDRLQIQKDQIEKTTAEQSREIRESIETDKRNLAKASAQTNAKRKRRVRIKNDVDTKRPM